MDTFSPYSMLYQTHHPLFLHFKPSSVTPPSLSSSQVEMACVEVALKGRFKKEMALKSNHQLDDLWTGNGGTSGVLSVEDFSVDDLLDFSKMGGAEEDGVEREEIEKPSCLSPSSPKEITAMENSTHVGNLTVKDDFASSELTVPMDDMASLEWLSHFVDDSFSEYSVSIPAGNLAVKPNCSPEKPKSAPLSTKIPCFESPIPAKTRTKRTRAGGRRWSFGSRTDSSSSSSSSSSTTSHSTGWLIYSTPSQIDDSFNLPTRPTAKKQRRCVMSEPGGAGGAQLPRRCSHCGVTKTPQWRAGPLGAKTLCNACGVRFKSGRLLPEYRPACSPTFSSEVHSNHHRKVLEMRKNKETVGSESGLAHPVPSFG